MDLWSTVAALFFVLHGAASTIPWLRREGKIDRELVIQHHERCAMLALIAVAVLSR